jgi:hypothetical protein
VYRHRRARFGERRGIGPNADGLRRRKNRRDEARTWAYRGRIPNQNLLDFSEPAVIEARDGRLIALLRADWDTIPGEQPPAEAKVGYGSFLYQTESTDGGRTWSVTSGGSPAGRKIENLTQGPCRASRSSAVALGARSTVARPRAGLGEEAAQSR